ncbi:MAG: class I SAM-dependent methyltransferase [Myxococcales bacterium]|nr:class I SAM-dependent methyltransferase [Myxococcales bacterium]
MAPGAKREDHERYFAARQAYNESRRRYFSDTAWLLLRAHLGHDLASRRVACDIGSGPGAFACLLRKAFPQLRAIAIDTSFAFDEYRQRSEAMLAEEGVEVELRASNALLDPLPDDVDLITFNRLLSGIPREGAGAWLDRAFDALAPGGVFAAADMFMSGVASHDRHVAAVIGLWMGRDRHVLDTDPPTSPDDDRHQWGWSRPWHAAELEALLRARGFVDTFSSPADPPFTLVGGRKP